MRQSWVVIVGLFTLYVIALLTPALSGSRALFWHDVSIAYLPLRTAAAEALRAGHLPLWEGRLGNGFPVLAEGQAGVFYPPHLLGLTGLPQYQVYAILAAAHLALAAMLMALLCRAWGLRLMPSLVAGATYGLSGFFVTHVLHITIIEAAAWLPGVLWCLERWLQRPGDWRPVAWAALLLGLQQLIAMPQIFFYSVLTVLLYLVVGAVVREGGRPRWWAVGLAAMGTLGGALALAAVQLLPTAGLIGQSARTEVTAATLRELCLAPRNLVYLLHPYLLGSYAEGNYFGQDHYYEVCGFAGTAALLFGVVGAVYGKGRGRAFGLALVPIALFMALANQNPLYEVFPHVPGFAWFRGAGRYVLLTTLGLAALAGWGLQVMAQDRRARRLVIVLGTLGAVLCLAAGPALNAARPIVQPKLAAMVGSPQEAGEKLDYLVARLSVSDPHMLLVMLSLGLPGLACAAVPLTGLSLTWVGELVLALLLVQLMLFGRGYNPTIEPDYYTDPPRIVAEPDPARGEALYMDDQDALAKAVPGSAGWESGDLSYYRAEREFVRPNRQVLYNARAASIFYALAPDRYWRLNDVLKASLQGEPEAKTGLRMVTPEAVLGALGAKVVCTANRGCLSGWPVVLDEGWWLARGNPEPAPRVYFAQRVTAVGTAQEGLAAMCEPGFDWRAPVVEGSGLDEVSDEGARVLGVEDTCGHLRIRCQAQGRALLVVRDTWDRHFRCRVDGRESPILRANYLFRGVALEAGEHDVEMAYDAREVRLGGVVSVLSALALLVWGGRRARSANGGRGG